MAKTTKTTTGDIREMLAASLKRATKGKLSAVDGKNIIGLSNQITKSMAVEIKHAHMQEGLGVAVDVFGSAQVGNKE
jgi:hypothetical protein